MVDGVGCLIAVSYTHLDVYKRQGIDTGRCAGNCRIILAALDCPVFAQEHRNGCDTVFAREAARLIQRYISNGARQTAKHCSITVAAQVQV